MVAMLKMPVSEYLSDEGVSERRVFQRKPTHGVAQGRRIDHTLSARQNPRLTLDLRDLSVGGLSAIADYPLDRGERLGVFVQGFGMARGWDAFGRVVRCEPSALGYRVAIEFDSLPAA
jgi:hypothetical protein